MVLDFLQSRGYIKFFQPRLPMGSVLLIKPWETLQVTKCYYSLICKSLWRWLKWVYQVTWVSEISHHAWKGNYMIMSYINCQWPLSHDLIFPSQVLPIFVRITIIIKTFLWPCVLKSVWATFLSSFIWAPANSDVYLAQHLYNKMVLVRFHLCCTCVSRPFSNSFISQG